MQIKDLDGYAHHWQLIGNIAHGRVIKKSSLHLLAREIIHTEFPTMQILEEVAIPLRKAETLYIDFYIPLLRKAIEVHGEQHYKFVPFYHNNPLGFIRHKKRDKDKQEWCEINNIQYVELPFNEDKLLWVQRIRNER